MGNAEYQRKYRATHPNYDRHHNDRQKRYTDRVKRGLAGFGLSAANRKLINDLQSLKRVVLTHYGGGKLACVKCGIDDIDCLSLDHINNDAHHRQNNGRVGGTHLYRRLMSQGYPKGYQTLCMNCNMKKAIEFCRLNGGNKKGNPQAVSLPLFEYFDSILVDVLGTTEDDTIKIEDDRRTTGDDRGYDSEDLTSFEITRY